MMLLMPLIFRRVSVKGILLLGLFAWFIRYALLASGNATDRMWMLYVAILIHGICYDFFFMTGQLYTDQEAPANLRNTAQGFFTFLTYGVGMFLGSIISGEAVDFFTTSAKPAIVRNWTGFWSSSSIAALILFLVFALFFRSRRMIRSKEKELLVQVS